MARSHLNSMIQLIQKQLERIEIRDHRIAQLVCRLIPASCPFERTVQLRDRVILRIPPLCKLNPFYEQLMVLRFRALVLLAEN